MEHEGFLAEEPPKVFVVAFLRDLRVLRAFVLNTAAISAKVNDA
jgi:hypothetical protein